MADSILVELNKLLDGVRSALSNTYIRDTGRRHEDFEWTNALKNEDYFCRNFSAQLKDNRDGMGKKLAKRTVKDKGFLSAGAQQNRWIEVV